MLPAYRVHLSNKTSFVLAMLEGVSIEQARSYFLDEVMVLSEDEETGKETTATVIAVGDARGEAYGNCDACCEWVILGEYEFWCEPCKVKCREGE